MLSIIIPTLNEEKYLPSLLNSIKQQKVKEDLEIIVADAGSRDKTLEIAKSFSGKIVAGGLPARGRNKGARVAKGDLLLFLDADLKLPLGFLENSFEEFRDRKLAVASYCLEPETKKRIVKTGFNLLYNRPITFSEKLLAYGAMGILVKKEIFEKVGGFDENVKLAEDMYFIRQASKIGKFGVIRSSKIYITLRRFESDGYFKTLFKYLLCNLYMFSGKAVRSDVFRYRFNHYYKTKLPKEAKVEGEDEINLIAPPAEKERNKV